MQAYVEGIIMEVVPQKPKPDGTVQHETRIFQPGEKNLICVKGTTGEQKAGQKFSRLCKIYPWEFKGKSGIAITLADNGKSD